MKAETDWKKALIELKKHNSTGVIAEVLEVTERTVEGWIKKAKGKRSGKTPHALKQERIIAMANKPESDKPKEKKVVQIPKKADNVRVEDDGATWKYHAPTTPISTRPTKKPVPPKEPIDGDADINEALRGLNIRNEDIFRNFPHDKGYHVNYRHILCFVTTAGKKYFWNLVKHEESSLEEYQKKEM